MKNINKWMTKKTVFIGSFVITTVLLLLILVDSVESCNYSYAYGGQITLCMTIFEYIKKLIIPFVSFFWLAPSLLSLSLITYWTKEQAFLSWWNFARWWVIIIIATAFFFEYMGDGGGLNMGGSFEILVLGILYTIMIVGSISKIVKTHLKTR